MSEVSVKQPNVVVLFPDQLRALSLPLFGEQQIETPNIDRLAADSLVLENAISNCPVCTPARAMLLTGRYPQTTGHLINTTRTRHSEISIGDAFGRAGYQTAWVGKWHLHTGLWPALDRMPQHPDWVPEGRDRLGFDYWRAYNQHMVYFDGFVHKDDWNYERWEGYETDGLLNYGFEFMDSVGEDPFLLFLSPHPPHYTPFKFAPDHCYERLPKTLHLPANVPEHMQSASLDMYRHYLAMILAVDDMLGRLLDYLERKDLANNTIVLFASDHGTQGGGQGVNPWSKKNPYENSIRIPALLRYPGVIEPGVSQRMTSMVDFFPTLCGLAGIPVPRSVEGVNLTGQWANTADDHSAFIMNFSKWFDWFQDGAEWRGVRTQQYTYAKWLNGKVELYDLYEDPLQMHNLAGQAGAVESQLDAMLQAHQQQRQDKLVACTDWKHWLDEQRRVVRNAHGPLSHPESEPDWSLLR
ncbi:MAG: sulfatase-like hydrolase/transferase [Proteobacteria bacterium]|nr:sulfatase-like hydrolase/transferase [Pseudomonadota bacterium]